MGPAETAGIVVITVALIQGLISLVKFMVEKLNGKKIQTKTDIECGLSDRQSEQLTSMYQTITQKDTQGMPLVYFPRESMGDIQNGVRGGCQTQANHLR